MDNDRANVKVVRRELLCAVTLIDFFVTGLPLETFMSGTIPCDVSDHLAIFMWARKCHVKQSNTKERFSFQKGNVHILNKFRCERLNVDHSDTHRKLIQTKLISGF